MRQPELDRRAFMAFFSTTSLAGTLFPGVLWAHVQQRGQLPDPTITTEMIAEAEKIAGLELTEEERDQMRRGLDRNAAAYEDLRALDIPNEVPPALLFEPVMPGVEADMEREEIPLRVSRQSPPAVSDDIETLSFLPLTQLAELVRSRQVSSEQLTTMYLERLKRYDPKLLFVVNLTEELALKQARRADQEIARGNYRGPLHGIPWGAKDLLATRDYPTSWGAEPYRTQMIHEDATVVRRLDEAGAVYEQLDRKDLLERTARLLAEENVVGWFSGRMEFGPRALGARSVLGDARSSRMQAQMNLKIKFRESFRPFAPSVLAERASDFFELDRDSPYMLLVAPLKEEHRIPIAESKKHLWGIEKLNLKRSEVPAITHVDYSARVQTVSEDFNPNYYDLLRAFERQTGCPLVVNTSFNVRGEPIVCSPDDAYTCFMRTAMDYLVLWPFLLDKKAQPDWNEEDDWRSKLELD